MKYLFILSFILVYAFFGLNLGYTNTSDWYTHSTYMFQHASFLHLAINCLSFLVSWIILSRIFKRWFILPALLIGFAVSFIPLCEYSLPTVGISGVVYAMVGMMIPYHRFKKAYLFYLSIAISLIVSYFLKNTNFWLHLFCFISGVLFSLYKIYAHQICKRNSSMDYK